MPADGSLIFNTKIDTDGFEKGTKQLSSKALDLKYKISATEAAIKNLRTELEKTGSVKVKTKVAESLEKDVAKAKERLRSFAAEADEIGNAKQAQLSGMGFGDDYLDKALEQDKAWQAIQEKITQAEAELERYTKALAQANDAAPLGRDTAAYQQKEQRLAELSGQLDVYRAKLRETEQAEQSASGEVSVMKSRLQRTISALNLFAKGAAKAGNALKTAFSKTAGKLIQNIGSHFKKANSSTNILEKSLRRIKNTLVRMFFYRLVHSPLNAVKDGLGEIARVSPEVNKNLSALKTESTYLKNSLAALAAPLVNLVTPAFTSFLQTLSGAINTTGQFVALLTGQTYTQAVKVQEDYAASLDESAKSAERSTKATKENQKALAAFDELNVLDVSDDGGSADEAAVSPYFETVDAQVGSLGNTLLNALNNQDFGAVGELLGDKINEGLSKIKWDKIKEKAKGTAEKVTSFINGFLKKTDWKLVGATIGGGIATALVFSNTLFGTLDWSGIGGALHEVIKGAFTGENLNLLGSTFALGVNGLIDLGTALVGDPDFKQLGASFEQSLQNMLKAIKWGELSRLFFKCVTGAFEFSNGFILKINWRDFGKGLADSFADFFGKGGDGRRLLNTIGETVGNFIVGTSEFIIAFFSDQKTADSFIDTLCDFFAKIPWIKIIVNSITGGIGMITWLIQAAGRLVESFCKGLADGFSNMENDPELMKALANLGVSLINLIITVFEAGIRLLVNGIPNLILGALKRVIDKFLDMAEIFIGTEKKLQLQQGVSEWRVDIPVNIPRVPYLASGTVVPANYGEFLAVLGDNKKEPEVVSPISAMKQAFLEALAEYHGGGDQPQEINLYIDGDRFFSWLIGKNNEYQKSHGEPAFKGGSV